MVVAARVTAALTLAPVAPAALVQLAVAAPTTAVPPTRWGELRRSPNRAAPNLPPTSARVTATGVAGPLAVILGGLAVLASRRMTANHRCVEATVSSQNQAMRGRGHTDRAMPPDLAWTKLTAIRSPDRIPWSKLVTGQARQ